MFVEEPDGNKLLRTHKFECENNIKVKIKETVSKVVDLVRLVQAEASGGLL
jgi:hypothetical protein